MAGTEPLNKKAVPHTENPQRGSRWRIIWSEYKLKFDFYKNIQHPANSILPMALRVFT